MAVNSSFKPLQVSLFILKGFVVVLDQQFVCVYEIWRVLVLL